MKRQIGLLLVGMTLPLGSLLAADGAIPIWEPTTITGPGSYVLVRDIEGGPIRIEADDVDLDLNGFRLNGAWPALIGSNIRGLAVHDGTIGPNFEDGISLSDVENVRLYQLQIASTDDNAIGIFDGRNIVVEDCQLGGGGYSLSVTGTNIAIRRNQILYGGLNIGASGNGGCTNCSLVENQVSGVVYVNGTGGVISGNVLLCDSQGMMVFGDGFLIADNTIRGATNTGLFINGNDNVYRGNIVRGNGSNPNLNCGGTGSGGDFCDEGTNNTSHGDNYMPGQM